MTRRDSEFLVNLPAGVLALRPLADGAIRVRFSDGRTPEQPSLMIVGSPRAAFDVRETPGALAVVTARMSAVVDRASGALSFRDAADREFLAEQPGSRRLMPATIQGEPTFAVEQAFLSPPDERLFGSGQFQDGHLDIRGLPRRLTQVNSQIAIPFLVSSRGYGLLWHNNGRTDINPADRRIELTPAEDAGRVTTVEVTTADGTRAEARQDRDFLGTFTVARAGRYALMLDVGQVMARRHEVEIDGVKVIEHRNFWLPPTTSWFQELSAGEHRVKVAGEMQDRPALFVRPSADLTVLRSPVADALDYIVLAGSADEVIATYRTLTGPAPLLPRWAFGYIHCRERFKTQRELLDNAAEFRARGLPMDVIVQDWQYWGCHGWNAMRFDEADYPDPAAMVRELHAMNVRLMLSVWSRIEPESEVGRQFSARGYFIPGTQWVDFFNPAAAALYWEHFSARLLSLGIDAWWQDATEPENDDLVGRQTHAGPGERLRLAYPFFVTKTVFEGQRRDAPDRRVCILTRSAFPGQQRYAAATWSGDIGNDWDALRRQIPAGLNLAVTGQPYWTTDGGGFFRPGAGQYGDADYHERFLRWFQYATFCPLQRVHGYQTDTEFWRYGPTVEQEARRYLGLRYRLLPYLYSQAAHVTFTGGTLMRPLVMDFADDAAALDQRYQFMFGPALLVSPVVQPGATTWEVYLPRHEGGWFDFWTGEKLAAGQTVKSAAPLAQIPLHVRAGSIVPLGPAMQHTGERPADPIELRVYRGADAGFALYEDEGDNYNYERGACATIPLCWDERSGTLSIGRRVGAFPGMLRERTFRVMFVAAGHGEGPDAAVIADAEVDYVGEPVTVRASAKRT